MELFKKCKRILLTKITDWKETPEFEETKVARILKETAMKEKIEEELSNQKLRRIEEKRNASNSEENKKKIESLYLVPAKVVNYVPTQQDPGVADLSCDNQLHPSLAKVGSTMTK